MAAEVTTMTKMADDVKMAKTVKTCKYKKDRFWSFGKLERNRRARQTAKAPSKQERSTGKDALPRNRLQKTQRSSFRFQLQ